jgi:hypothetical protein
LQLAAKELTLLEANTVAQSESRQSFAQLLELGDYEDTPTRSQRLAFTGTLLASDTWAYNELEIENPDEDRGDLTWKEYKEDLGFGDLGFWRPVLRDRLSALFWLHERRWHRRSERRKKQARKEIDTVRTRLEGAQEQLADVQSTIEDVNERLQENRETVSDLRSVVNEIQTRPYDTRPEIYERLNEIREDYGIENEIEMRVVVGDADDPEEERQSYLAYMRGAQRSIQQRQDDEATPAPEPAEEINVPGAARTGPEEAPIVDTRRELAAVYEAQTGRELPDGDERRAVMERNVIVERDSKLLNEIADTSGFTSDLGRNLKERLVASSGQVWSDGKMFLIGPGGEKAREATDLEGYPEGNRIKPEIYFPPTEASEEVSLIGVVGGSEGDADLYAYTGVADETDPFGRSVRRGGR